MQSDTFNCTVTKHIPLPEPVNKPDTMEPTVASNMIKKPTYKNPICGRTLQIRRLLRMQDINKLGLYMVSYNNLVASHFNEFGCNLLWY